LGGQRERSNENEWGVQKTINVFGVKVVKESRRKRFRRPRGFFRVTRDRKQTFGEETKKKLSGGWDSPKRKPPNRWGGGYGVGRPVKEVG